MAWRRRSLALVLLVVAFAFQFLPWTRIERATFALPLPDRGHLRHGRGRLRGGRGAALVGVAAATPSPSWCWPRSSGFLVYPLGSAMAMPDWYINAARSYPPWNYDFQFPDPPQGPRAELLSATRSSWPPGRWWPSAPRRSPCSAAPYSEPRPPHGDDEQDEPRPGRARPARRTGGRRRAGTARSGTRRRRRSGSARRSARRLSLRPDGVAAGAPHAGAAAPGWAGAAGGGPPATPAGGGMSRRAAPSGTTIHITM